MAWDIKEQLQWKVARTLMTAGKKSKADQPQYVEGIDFVCTCTYLYFRSRYLMKFPLPSFFFFGTLSLHVSTCEAVLFSAQYLTLQVVYCSYANQTRLFLELWTGDVFLLLVRAYWNLKLRGYLWTFQLLQQDPANHPGVWHHLRVWPWPGTSRSSCSGRWTGLS
jgi:hypothetical protein